MNTREAGAPSPISRRPQRTAGGGSAVLKTLRAKARERQRYALGIPLLLLGAIGLAGLARKASSAAPRMPFGM